MYRRACPPLLLALVIGLVRTRQRLTEAEAKLRLLSATAPPRATAEPVPGAVPGTAGPESFSEWEQAVPPMDS